MKTLLIAIVGIALFGAGVYLYSNSQDGLRQLKQKNYSVAKSSEIVGLKNGDSYNLTAGIVKKNINGIDVKMLAYNGSIPGPLI